MPVVYRLICSNCSGDSQEVEGVAGFVSSGERLGGTVMPASYLAFQRDDGELVCLMHPLENSILEANGGEFDRSSRSGRLFRVTYKVCKDCGTMNEEKQIHDARFHCLLTPILMVSTFCIARFILNLHSLTSFGLIYVPLFALGGISSLLYRHRWGKLNDSMKLKACVECGGSNFTTIPKLKGQSNVCPTCKTHNLECVSAGIS